MNREDGILTMACLAILAIGIFQHFAMPTIVISLVIIATILFLRWFFS